MVSFIHTLLSNLYIKFWIFSQTLSPFRSLFCYVLSPRETLPAAAGRVVFAWDLTGDSAEQSPEWSCDSGRAAAREPLAGSAGDAWSFGLHLYSYNPGTGLVRNYTPTHAQKHMHRPKHAQNFAYSGNHALIKHMFGASGASVKHMFGATNKKTCIKNIVN